MKSLMNSGIEVIFVKVDSHTGDLYNEIADEKCKEALNIESNNEFYKYLGSNEIIVSNNLVKEKLKNIAKDRDYNIISKDDSIIIDDKDASIILKAKVKEEATIDNNYKEEEEIIEKLRDILKKLPKEKQKDILSYGEYLLNKEINK